MSASFMLRLLTAALLGGQLVGACALEREGSQSELPESHGSDPQADSRDDVTGMRDPKGDVAPVVPDAAPPTDSGLQTDPTADAGSPLAPPAVGTISDASLSIPLPSAPTPAPPGLVDERARAATAPVGQMPTPGSLSAAQPQPQPQTQPAPMPQAPPQPEPEPEPEPEPQFGFRVSSAAFEQGGSLPSIYACDGVPPPLRWEGAPAGTSAYALSFTEIDGSGRRPIWALNSLPGSISSLGQDARGALMRYGMPLCRVGARYEYTLYALSRAPSAQSITRTEFIGGQVVSTYRPPDGVLSSTTLSAYFTGR